MSYVTVRFTTKKLCSVFDALGNKVHDIVEDIPQCVSGIPRSTADGFKHFDNWSVEPFYGESDGRSERRKSDFNDRKTAIAHGGRRAGKSVAAKVAAAAASGDYAAAINALGADNG